MKMTTRIVTLLVFIFILAGCVPAVVDTRPKIAFINAPSKSRITGLAEKLEALLKEQDTTFGYSRASALRFQETHRDMYGSRARLQAAFTARSQGSAYAVMVGSDYNVEVVRSGLKDLTVELMFHFRNRAKATIIDPVTAGVLGNFESNEVTATRYETVTLKLPEGVDPKDPSVKPLLETQISEATDRAVQRLLEDTTLPLEELVAPVANELTRLVRGGA